MKKQLMTIPIQHKPFKRLFDLLCSILALILLSPLFLILFLLIKCTSTGNAIYAHMRVGRGGKSFFCYKFRTMYPDADQRIHKLLQENPRLKEEWLLTRKLKNDPRVTPIGKFLRKTSLDELPQFINVLRGDLSIVGPRPVVLDEVHNHLGDKATKILSVRPGLTCIWQVSGRNDICYSKRIELDEHYIDNHSFLLDLKLILKTIPAMIRPKGAY